MKLILAAIVLALLWRSRRKPVDTAPCWFCHRIVPVEALIAGYDTWDEQRFACLACNEIMSPDDLLPVDPYTWTMA